MDETALFMDETALFMDENVIFQSYGSKGHFMDETAKLMEKKKYQPQRVGSTMVLNIYLLVWMYSVKKQI